MVETASSRILLFAACALNTAGATAHDETGPELSQLLQVLEQQTEIATKTGLNKDYVPDHVTILVGSDLQQRGIRTVARALRLVPGLDVMQDETGTGQVLGGGKLGFDNVARACTCGLEVEAERRFNRYVAVDGNLSYAQPHDGSSDTDITDSTHWLGNLGLHLTPWNELDVHLQFTHAGEHARAPGDTRDNMTAYTTADLAIEWQAAQRLILRSGLRNLADMRRHDPAPADTYVDDFPRRGRTLWLGLAYQSSV